MAKLNHFAISAALGSTLGPRVPFHHGQLGSSELAATLSQLLHRRSAYIEDLSPQDHITQRYEKAIIRAFKMVRNDFSSDRVLADPDLDRNFIEACHDLGLEDCDFHLNMALIGLRKHKKLRLGKSRRVSVPDQWRYCVASEMAARAIYYQHGASVDTILSHPKLAREFDRLAMQITPGFTSFQYRWAALNMRKKGASAKVVDADLQSLEWSGHLKFTASRRLPTQEGVYRLDENEACLFVAGTENLRESITGQRRIAEVPLFPGLWTPDPQQLTWNYTTMPNTSRTYRWGVVYALVGQLRPVFNIPRGEDKDAA